MLIGISVRLRKAGGIQYKEHDHRIACRVFPWIQFLQTLHGFQSKWSRGVVQPQHVGGKIHEDAAGDRMSFGDIREELAEERAQYP